MNWNFKKKLNWNKSQRRWECNKNLETRDFMQTSITICCLNEYSNYVAYTNVERHTVA